MSDGCGCGNDETDEGEHQPAVNDNAPGIDAACPVPEASDAGAGA